MSIESNYVQELEPGDIIQLWARAPFAGGGTVTGVVRGSGYYSVSVQHTQGQGGAEVTYKWMRGREWCAARRPNPAPFGGEAVQ